MFVVEKIDICRLLARHPKASVQKARELQPDLILLDIGLPKLNGNRSCHQICRIVPAAIILFGSQISDADVVEEALSIGAKGYVLKQGAGQRPRDCSRSCSTWRALCQYRSCKIPRDIILGLTSSVLHVRMSLSLLKLLHSQRKHRAGARAIPSRVR